MRRGHGRGSAVVCVRLDGGELAMLDELREFRQYADGRAQGENREPRGEVLRRLIRKAAECLTTPALSDNRGRGSKTSQLGVD